MRNAIDKHNRIRTADKLAEYRKAVERWKRLFTEATTLHGNAKTDNPKPTPDSCKPEKCDPSDFGLDESTKFFTDKIVADIFK